MPKFEPKTQQEPVTVPQTEVNKTPFRKVPFKCPKCNGYGTVGFANDRQECPVCKLYGFIIVDQVTGTYSVAVEE
jgi:hypothetical protein